jgi:cell division protease FtsH
MQRDNRTPIPGPNGPKKPFTSSRTHVTALVAITALVAFLVFQLIRLTTDKPLPLPEVTFSGAVEAIGEGKVSYLKLNDASRRAVLVLQNGTQVVTTYPDGSGPELARAAIQADVKVQATPVKSASIWMSLLFNLLPVLLFVGLFVVFLGPRMGIGIGRFGKGKGKPAEVPSTRFSDVAGVNEAVEELAEVVDFLHNPERFYRTGARVPHGVLLVGPPGTGKTLLARAVAGEAGVPFFALAGSDFVETFVGVGASRVRQVFSAARKRGRAIIFIDEIDAVGKVRTSGPSNGGGAEERENTLNQLLVEMDGFHADGIIVLAATNRADVLDPALTRPGRFDRRVTVPAPDRAGRTRILELYVKERELAPDVDLVTLARRTPGLTGADLELLVNEAALGAARRGSDVISAADLDAALATAVLGRERKSAVITERDRKVTAWHEAGHALAGILQPAADDPVSVTIVPRGPAGGVTWYGGNDNTFMTRSEAEAQLVSALAGRAAEELLLDGDFTQGAASDFTAATQLATRMVTEYGMSDLGVANRASHLHAMGAQADEIGAAVDTILKRALGKARDLIRDNAPLLEAVVQELLAEETVEGGTLVALAERYGARQPQLAAAVTPTGEVA